MHVTTNKQVKNRTAVRIFALLAALAFGAAGAMLATGSAQAAAPANHDPGGRVVTLPPTPAGAESSTDHAVAAVSPTISPAARRTYHANPGDVAECPLGNLCPAVWDYTTGNWKVFELFFCDTYALSNWLDVGHHQNNQTGNVLSVFFDQSFNRIKEFRPDYPNLHLQDWTPVWYIRNC